MPIRTQNGRTIPLQASTSTGAKLRVPHKYQQQSNWCWAACAEMVMRYRGNTNTDQCDLANWLFNLTVCCSQGSSPQCNNPCTVSQVSNVYINYGIQSVLSGGTISFAAIQSEINGQRPVEVGLKWNKGTTGHLVIIQGWQHNRVGQYVHLNDPAPGYGPQLVLYTDLLKAFQKGQWVLTWTSIR